MSLANRNNWFLTNFDCFTSRFVIRFTCSTIIQTKPSIIQSIGFSTLFLKIEPKLWKFLCHLIFSIRCSIGAFRWAVDSAPWNFGSSSAITVTPDCKTKFENIAVWLNVAKVWSKLMIVLNFATYCPNWPVVCWWICLLFPSSDETRPSKRNLKILLIFAQQVFTLKRLRKTYFFQNWGYCEFTVEFVARKSLYRSNSRMWHVIDRIILHNILCCPKSNTSFRYRLFFQERWSQK